MAEANAAIDNGLAALQRLYGGEVWEEERVPAPADVLTEEERKQGVWVEVCRLRFVRAAKPYLGYQRAGGPLQSVQQVTENSVLEDLVNRYVQRSGPMIVPERPDHQLPTEGR